MMSRRFFTLLLGIGLTCCLLLSMTATADAMEVQTPKAMGIADVLAASTPSDWRPLEPENTLYVEMATGRVIIELAPAFAPIHVANVKALAREHYFDGLAIIRVQENYVVQWGDPNGEKPDLSRKIEHAHPTLPAEFDHPIPVNMPFTLLPDGDVYAQTVGFSDGFPLARDKSNGRMWLIHSYGMVGAGRGNTADSGGGTELYVVIGQAPRHLDRNCTLFGRVIQGMELLSSLPRGTGPMGFFAKPEENIPIISIRVAADVPLNEQSPLEILRSDTPLFLQYIEARRNRNEDWFLNKAGHIDICNIPIPVRKKN